MGTPMGTPKAMAAAKSIMDNHFIEARFGLWCKTSVLYGKEGHHAQRPKYMSD